MWHHPDIFNLDNSHVSVVEADFHHGSFLVLRVFGIQVVNRARKETTVRFAPNHTDTGAKTELIFRGNLYFKNLKIEFGD